MTPQRRQPNEGETTGGPSGRNSTDGPVLVFRLPDEITPLTRSRAWLEGERNAKDPLQGSGPARRADRVATRREGGRTQRAWTRHIKSWPQRRHPLRTRRWSGRGALLTLDGAVPHQSRRVRTPLPADSSPRADRGGDAVSVKAPPSMTTVWPGCVGLGEEDACAPVACRRPGPAPARPHLLDVLRVEIRVIGVGCAGRDVGG